VNQANGWCKRERVYIQAQTFRSVLVQYVQRRRVTGEQMKIDRDAGKVYYRRAIHQWEWVPIDAVTWDWEVAARTKQAA
jgi:hypothetical protein